MKPFTPTSLLGALHRLVEERYPSVEVQGEVAQLQVPGSGHCYFSLRDAEAVLSGVFWRSHWQGLVYRPRVGDQVVVRGKLGVYAGQGRLQLYGTSVAPAGEGRLAAEIAARHARLEAEGLFDPRRKRALPRFPRVVGIATSATGAALQDFLRVSRERFPATRILLAPCVVQGVEAPASILQAVELLIEHGQAEVIVVARGGGSKTELLAFQDEQLARFLAECPVPVVAAIGHEIDVSLVDKVADRSVPTPTAAAVAVLPDGPALSQRIDDAELRLLQVWTRLASRRKQRLAELRQRLKHPRQRLLDGQRRLVDWSARLQAGLARLLRLRRDQVQSLRPRLVRALRWRVESGRGRFSGVSGRLQALSPLAVLDRGYALVEGPAGLVRRPEDAPAGTRVQLRLAHGRLPAVITRDGE